MSVGAFLPLEHLIWKKFKDENLQGSSLLIAVSGGIDSMVLLDILCTLKEGLQLNLGVAYIHHGMTQNKDYRNQARVFVEDESCKRGLFFFSNNTINLNLSNNSEETLRKLRYQELARIRTENNFSYLVLGHQWDDLLETRLIRLIRGTGSNGLISMSFRKENQLRPLLTVSRSEIEHYSNMKKTNYLEDPSNFSQDPLRNWIRANWLSLLEQKRPGSIKSLARSLDLISQQIQNETVENLNIAYLDRFKFLELSREKKRQRLATFLHMKNIKGYQASHIDEVIKRLETSQKNLWFKVAKCQWSVNAEQIRVDPIFTQQS